jgi:nucleoid DNA-binding protein
MTKTQVIARVTGSSNVPKDQVEAVLEALQEVAISSLKSDGEFVIPGLVKITSKDKPATSERQAMNPFTKLSITIPAKPASKKLAAKPVGPLKKAILT